MDHFWLCIYVFVYLHPRNRNVTNIIFSNIFYYKYTKTIITDTITWLVTKYHTALKSFIKPPLKASVINSKKLNANVRTHIKARC